MSAAGSKPTTRFQLLRRCAVPARTGLGFSQRSARQDHNKGGAGGNIDGPEHRWTCSPSGELLGTPQIPHEPCLNLNNVPLQEWNGLLFESNGHDVTAELVQLGPRARFDFSGLAFDRIEVHECNYDG